MIKGVDLSAWQETVNWQGLIDNGMGFAIVKLGERDRLTETFVDQINQAKEHGLKIGVYYYSHALTEADAIAEADWVARTIKQYLPDCPEMGIWYDIEDPEILNFGADITALCSAFVNRVRDANLGYVGIYSSYNWLTNYIDVSQLNNIPLWVAQYNYQNDYSLENPNANVRIWQFTDHISDELPYDGNIYYL